MKRGFAMPFSKETVMRDHIGQDDISGFLAEGAEVKGEIRCRQIFRVDGKVSGKIVSEGELVVGESGVVDTEVQVGTLSVSGRITGSVSTTEKIEIHPRSKGDISLTKPNLLIHEGGVFEGNIEMGTAARPDARDGADDAEGPMASVEPFRRP